MKRKKTMIYEALGFPIKLVNVPVRKILGEEVLDINLHQLQIAVLRLLVYKPSPLTGDQLRFIRKFLEMSTTQFAKKFGVTHPTVLKWEKGATAINPTAEFCIRLHTLQAIQNEDLRKLCTEITIEGLVAHEGESDQLIEIDQECLMAG